MGIQVQVGQHWRDNDKRRDRVVEVLHVADNEVHALILGTENETSLKLDRFVKRWTLVTEKAVSPKPKPPTKPLKRPERTREEWLQTAVVVLIEDIFEPNDIAIPAVRVSVGWPGGRGSKGKVIGQCWKTETATDKVSQIFISPVVADPVVALAVLAHELIHASDDGASGHRGHFKKTAQAVGFKPKFTESNPDDDFKAKLEEIAEGLGEYPHAALSETAKPKVQKTYMLKLVSPEEPDYFLRMTQNKLDEYGPPIDPWGNEMELE